MYDAMTYWRYAMVVFFSLTIMFPNIQKLNYVCRVISRAVAPYFYSFLPVGMLVYMLYVVATRL